jgi:integrase
MRSSEVLAMRGRDLNTTGGVWEYQPASHKSEHRGKDRQVFLGPKAQAVVKEFLSSDLQAYLFNPSEAVRVCGPVGKVYRRDAYRRAITRACERAFGMPHELRYPEHKISELPEEKRAAEVKWRRRAAAEWRREDSWFPHQLRHSAATIIRGEAGIESARCVLGHSELSTTELYAEADLTAMVSRQMGHHQSTPVVERGKISQRAVLHQ